MLNALLFLDCSNSTIEFEKAYTVNEPFELIRSKPVSFPVNLTLDCFEPYTYTKKWTVNLIDSATHQVLKGVDLFNNISTVLSELYIPENTLTYGLYEVIYEVNVTMTVDPYINFTNFRYNYFKIVPSGIAINGIENGVTSLFIGSNQEFHLTPTNYSYDLDELADLSSLNYKYYCRTIDLTSILIDNSTMTDLGTYKTNAGLAMNANKNCFSSSAASKFWLILKIIKNFFNDSD